MSLCRPLSKRACRLRGWLIPAALLALAPKCILCAMAYAGIGAALGLGGPELCGASPDTASHWRGDLAAIAAGMLLVGWLLRSPHRAER